MQKQKCRPANLFIFLLTMVMLFGAVTPMASAQEASNQAYDSISLHWLRPTATNRFVDVPNYPHWQNDPVSWADRNNITTGIAGTHPPRFNPDGRLSREMFATFLHRIAGTPTAGTAGFNDQGSINGWAVSAVNWASSINVIQGFEGNIFGPQRNIQRQQIATMLFRYAQSLGLDTTASAGALAGFSDSYRVGTWATTAMRWAVHHGIITGINNQLAPVSNATRAQTVTMLQRFVEIFNIPSPGGDGSGGTPTPPTPPGADVLVGTWNRQGEPYYTFRSDGTGADRWSELDWWRARAGVLAICTTPGICRNRGECISPREWNYTISGNTLTLNPISFGTVTILTNLPTQPLVISESGYSVHQGFFGDFEVHYAIYIYNPNTHIQAWLASYRVTAFGAGGAVLATQTGSILNLNPQRTNVFAGRRFTNLAVSPARVEFEVLQPGSFGWRDSHEIVRFAPLVVEQPSVSGDNVVGNVRNTNSHAIESVRAVAVFRDAGGNILGGEDTWINNLSANGTAPFSIWVWGRPYITETLTVYAFPN